LSKIEIVTPDLPMVCKVGHAHAGFGKVRLQSSDQVADFKSLAALHGDYITAEVSKLVISIGKV